MVRYGSELLVVFVGVWLSLLAEDWRQARNDAETEMASMARMAEDLEADLRDLRFNLDRAQAGVSGGRMLANPTRRSDVPGDSLAHALSATQLCSMFIENAAEYVALRNSGQLGIVTDAELRRRIVAAYENRSFLHMLHEDDCDRTETVLRLMTPYVRLAEPPEAAQALQMSSDGFPDTSRPRVAALLDERALFSRPEFVNALTTLVARRRFLANQIMATIDESEAIRQELLARVDAAS